MTKNAIRTMLLAVITVAASSEMQAGAAPNPKSADTSVSAYGRDRFEPIVFRGGEAAFVALKGDGDTDLDLYIYDDNGNLVAKDDDGLDLCIARWTPRYTGYFTIVVRNRGGVYNRYVMRTN